MCQYINTRISSDRCRHCLGKLCIQNRRIREHILRNQRIFCFLIRIADDRKGRHFTSGTTGRRDCNKVCLFQHAFSWCQIIHGFCRINGRSSSQSKQHIRFYVYHHRDSFCYSCNIRIRLDLWKDGNFHTHSCTDICNIGDLSTFMHEPVCNDKCFFTAL